VTADEYRGKLRGFGLTPAKPAYEGAQLYQDRDRQFVLIPDPETLSEVERVDFIELIKGREGYSDPN
jgi:hypothetical protein